MIHDLIVGFIVLSVAGIIGDTVVKIFRAKSAGKKLEGQVQRMEALLVDQNAALEAARQGLVDQQTQIQDLHDRVEFAERLLTQGRDRESLGPGSA